jgi:hypothetical protein
MTCKGICIRHKALGRYTDSCKNCDLFIKWEGLRCPCCRYQLRTGPSANKSQYSKIH